MAIPSFGIRRVFGVALLPFSLVFVTPSRAQTTYQFAALVTSGNATVSGSFGAPALSAGGLVAYTAARRAGGTGVYVSGTGGTLTTIADTSSGTFRSFAAPSINGTGVSAFSASLSAGGSGVYAGSGGALTTIADRSTNGGEFSLLNLGESPSINGGGSVAFAAETPDPAYGIFLNAGGTVSTVVQGADVTPVYTDPSINLSGAVAYDDPSAGIYRNSGGATTTIASTSSGTFSSFGESFINAGGTVAFRAQLAAGGFGIFAGSGGAVTTVASTAAGAFQNFSSASINDSGIVAFGGTLANGTKGIFTGPRPATDSVIKIGDTLAGSTVTGLSFSRFGLNNNGQIAFAAALANGQSGIFVATAETPEADSRAYVLAGLEILAFSAILRWIRKHRRNAFVSAEGR